MCVKFLHNIECSRCNVDILCSLFALVSLNLETHKKVLFRTEFMQLLTILRCE